jgi:putative transposase
MRQEWLRSRSIRKEIEVDEFVVMPNHVHGIVWIVDNDERVEISPIPNRANVRDVGAHGRAPLRRPPKSLGSFVAGFKSACTKRINIARGTPGERVWQRNFRAAPCKGYERVIRDDDELNRAQEYIINNPLKWELDKENPGRRKDDRPDPKNTRMIQTFCLD